MSGYSNRTWRCPYYRRDYRDRMSCDGGIVALPTPEATKAYMHQYCAGCWESCSLARALTKEAEKNER